MAVQPVDTPVVECNCLHCNIGIPDHKIMSYRVESTGEIITGPSKLCSDECRAKYYLVVFGFLEEIK